MATTPAKKTPAKKTPRNTPKVEINPDQIPEFMPPTNDTALVAVEEDDTDPFVVQMMDLIRIPMSSPPEVLTQKAVGLMECAKVLDTQRRKVAYLLGEVAQNVEDGELWKFVPGNQVSSPDDYWRQCNWEPTIIRNLLGFKRKLEPALQKLGVDPITYFEESTDAGIRAAIRVVKDVEREKPNLFKSDEMSDEDTKDVRERLLQYKGVDSREVRKIEDMQRPDREPAPLYVRLEIVTTPQGVRFRGSFEGDLETAEAFGEHRGYYAINYDGVATDWFRFAELLRNVAAAEGVNVVSTGSDIDPDEEDEAVLAGFGRKSRAA